MLRGLGLALACVGGFACGAGEPEPELQLGLGVGAGEDGAGVHAQALERLHALEEQARATTDFAALPSSDGRFGADPYALARLPDGRVAVLARGEDRVLLVDVQGQELASAPTPHDPTDLVLRDDEVLVVGTGEARLVRYELETLSPRSSLALPEALAPRALASDGERVWIADEGYGRVHELGEDAGGELAVVASHDYCRGPLTLARVDDWLVGNCLLEHRLRLDPIVEGSLVARDLDGPVHDGPIWSFEVGPSTEASSRLVALTGVEDHPLERRDGGFGYIDSFVFIDELSAGADGSPEFTRRALVNSSELGVVTPKWSRWLAGEHPTLALAGYASADVLILRWEQGFDAEPAVERWPGLPGTRAAVPLEDGSLLAATPLLDALLRLREDGVERLPIGRDAVDDRSFPERLGEALVFTTAMAPQTLSEGKRSRFTCETCHFEGRGDGRVHFTGREREGQRVHASSKPLLGLYPNRPHFSRAYDRDMATMVDNEFAVANRFSPRDPWAALDVDVLPWLAELPAWPAGGVDGEGLREALMRFLMRWSMPQNPAARGRASFSAPELAGAELFAAHCEGCHQARLVADDPRTRVALGTGEGAARFEPWRALIFADNGPLVWASEAYAATSIRPYVDEQGARVPSLRRLYMKWPYFTNGAADSLEAVLAGVRLGAQVDHTSEGADEDAGLDANERAALLAFLRLL